MNTRTLFLILLLGLAACASHPPRCRGALTPINPPTPATAAHP